MITADSYSQKKEELTKDELKTWFEKDLLLDSIPGISLQRAYDSILKDKKGKEVIVAIIDTELDINHEHLKNNIWVNADEIPNNGKDDDQNGYVDDINGWNFIGNLEGDQVFYSSMEFVRIIQKYRDVFEVENPDKNNPNYQIYLDAKEYYDKKLKGQQSIVKHGNFLYTGYPKAKAAMKKLYPNEDYTTKELDSIYETNKTSNPTLAKNAYFISDVIKYDLTEKWIHNYKRDADGKLNYSYDLNYFDKENIDSFPEDINYISYGNPIINKHLDEFYHGTLIAGLVTGENGTNSFKGINPYAKIMTVSITSNGNEHDKDIAVAIKYAVDNGAKVINMSFGKDFSLHREWVFKAFQYAEKNNVLIISSCGNSTYNLNTFNNYYPVDNIDNGKEVSDNFLLVGSSCYLTTNKLLSYYSNYGNVDVDMFAPGQDVYSTKPYNEYDFDSGTSLSSAITTGVASLLLSHYPDLTAIEVKQILMNSGLSFDLEVTTSTKEDKEKTTPFNQLSKSGRILNAYNALIMADSISRR